MAPPKKPWFRFYAEAASDRKIRRLKPEYRWLFVAVLCAARQSPRAGHLLITEGEALTADDLADVAAMPARAVRAGMAALESAGLVAVADHGGWWVPAWDARQFESDGVTDRVRKHRSKKPDVTPDVTVMERSIVDGCNGKVTPPDTDTETDTDTDPLKVGSEAVQTPSPTAPDAPTGSRYAATFEAWWADYPNKTGKGAAAAAYVKAARKVGHARLTEALAEHNAAWRADPSRFVPNPLTWLNQARYDDPPPQPRGRPQRNGRPSKQDVLDAALAGMQANGQPIQHGVIDTGVAS